MKWLVTPNGYNSSYGFFFFYQSLFVYERANRQYRPSHMSYFENKKWAFLQAEGLEPITKFLWQEEVLYYWCCTPHNSMVNKYQKRKKSMVSDPHENLFSLDLLTRLINFLYKMGSHLISKDINHLWISWILGLEPQETTNCVAPNFCTFRAIRDV